MDNSDKIILDLCGGTGSWSKPYKDNGYDVRVVTLPENDVRTWKGYKGLEIHGILAAPPCDNFSKAKHFHGKGNYTHDFAEGLAIADACKRIADVTSPKFFALENPDGYLKEWYGNPIYIFNPWEFGDNWQKRTCLWGYFVFPLPIAKHKPEGIIKFSMLKSKDIFPEYYGKLSRKERRAITPPGFAQAFYEANK
jgi:hypothetical protein